MEGRMQKYRQLSPERAKVWTEKSPKYHYNYDQYSQHKRHHHHHHHHHHHSNGKVPVIYYLCRNRQLEHPHFMEVPLSSTDGLYLRDVIARLNALRGRGIASMYSWSCKRSYKSGYVWHDLCDDDLILPAHGNEYVLKGSELFEQSTPGRFSPASTLILQNQKALLEPPSSRSQEESSSSSSLNCITTNNSQEDEMSPPVQRPSSSPEASFYNRNSPWNGSFSLTEYKVYKGDGLADASTQTEEKTSEISKNVEICTRGVSTDDNSLERGNNCVTHQDQISRIAETSSISRPLVSPPPSTPSTSSSSGRTDTLESLIRADARKLSSLRILEEEEFRSMRPSTRFKASNMILQLVSCGSISVKDHSFGLIPTYKPKFSHSPFFSKSLMLGEKEYFSGSIIETSMVTTEGLQSFRRSSSYNDDRSVQKLDSVEDNDEAKSSSSKCIPRSIKASMSKQSIRSPMSDGPRISSDRFESSRTVSACTSNGGSKRMTFSVKQGSDISDDDNVIRIEERLASGARVIIQSKISADNGVMT